MIRLALLGLLLCYFAVGEGLAAGVTSLCFREDDCPHFKKVHRKNHKPKKRKSKKHESKKKRKLKIYSAHKIDELLQNDHNEKVCNRLNCSSNLEVAKSCLPTKASHHTERKCFRAFCAYGCNEEDYKTNPDIRNFCNLTCSSKKYLRK